MGYLLKEALKTLCGVNQWAYAVFWKIGCQNPKLLIWEECYYEPIIHSGFPHITGVEDPEITFEESYGCWRPAEVCSSNVRVQGGDRVCTLVNRMMMDNQVNVVGEGLIGRAAFTGNHQWIVSENSIREAYPPEVLNEVCQQFLAGMQTVAIIPVLPHGVVQLGSSSTIMENIGFVNDVKTLILHLGYVPGALFSENYSTKEAAPGIGVPFCLGVSVSADPSGNCNVINSSPVVADSCNQHTKSIQASGSQSLIIQNLDNPESTSSTFQTHNLGKSFVESHGHHGEQKAIPVAKPNLPFKSRLKSGMTGAEVIPSNPEALLNQQASFCVSRSKFDQHPVVGTSAAYFDCLRSLEQEILTGAGVLDQANSGSNASNAFMTTQLELDEGLISSSGKNVVMAQLPEGKLQNGMSSHFRSFSNLSSLSNAKITAKASVSRARLSGNVLQNGYSSKTEVSTSDLTETTNQLLPDIFNCGQDAMEDKCAHVEFTQMKEVNGDLFQALDIPMGCLDGHMTWSEHDLHFVQNNQKHDSRNQSPTLDISNFGEACHQHSSGDDLFDVLGMDFKNKLFNGTLNNILKDERNMCGLDKNNSMTMKCEDMDLDSCVNDGNLGSGIFSVNGSDHLLDAVVSRGCSVAKKNSDDSVSCRTTSTKISNSHVPSVSSSDDPTKMPDQMRGELFGLTNSLAKAGAVQSCLLTSGSCKKDSGNYSQKSSIYGSQISSWVEQGRNMNHSSSVSSAYSKKSDETSKSNRKRLKPGENPRPRPKDRQMIQDRVKELREIVPNGAKCSIDSLLERTIKHMLFLQSVTKHADKLKQTGESKIISNEGGLLLKDNFEGGATWAYEVGSQSMVCPIIVEDLNTPRQMLVEMLCEERGLFLEIADIIRGLGLTILKGVMETRSDKIWARFAVEANRDVTRMEIFISLVRLLEQTVKSSSAMPNGIDNDNMLVHQAFHQAASISATGRPCGLP